MGQTTGGNAWLVLGISTFGVTGKVGVSNAVGQGWLRPNAVRFHQ